MTKSLRTLIGSLLLILIPLTGCSTVGAGAGGYAGYELGCGEGKSKEECAAATGAGAIGGAAIGDALE